MLPTDASYGRFLGRFLGTRSLGNSWVDNNVVVVAVSDSDFFAWGVGTLRIGWLPKSGVGKEGSFPGLGGYLEAEKCSQKAAQ